MGNDYTDQLDEERDALAPPIDPADLEAVAPQLLPTPASVAPVPAQVPVGAPVPVFDVKGYGEGADPAALLAAEGQRDQTDRAAKFLDASHSFNAAFGGNLPSTADAARATRNDSFQDVMRRRAMSDQDTQRAKLQHDTGMAAALARPDSPESVSRKEKFFGSSVGRHMYELMGPEAAARLPGSAIPGDKEQLASETSLMMAGLKADAKGKSGNDERAAVLGALVAAAGGPESKRGQFFSQTFANVPTAVIKTQGFQLLNNEEAKKFQHAEGQLRDQAHINAARIAAGRRDEEKREGQTEDITKDLKEGAGFGSNLKIINEVLDKSKTAKTGDIPGIGVIDSPKNEYLGGFLETNPEGQRMAKAARSMMLAYRNLVTGSAASNQEDKRIADAGLSLVNENGFRVGLDNMSRRYYDLLNRTYAGKDPRAVQMFIARNPDYEIPGDPRFGVPVAKQAAAKYSALSNLADIRPALVELESLKGGGSAPAVPTETPIREPGGAPAPVPSKLPPGKYRSKVTGKVKIVHPDGTEEEVAG